MRRRLNISRILKSEINVIFQLGQTIFRKRSMISELQIVLELIRMTNLQNFIQDTRVQNRSSKNDCGLQMLQKEIKWYYTGRIVNGMGDRWMKTVNETINSRGWPFYTSNKCINNKYQFHERR